MMLPIALGVLLLVIAALLVREAWLGYPPPACETKVLTRKEQAFLHASAEVFFPTGGSLPSATDAGVVPYVDRTLADLPRRQRFLIRCLFVLLEHGSLIFGPVRRRVTRQTSAERLSTFRAWEGSDIYFRRLSFLSLRTLLTFAYFGDRTVFESVSR